MRVSSVWSILGSVILLGSHACGDCAGVGLSRLNPTEQTIRIGASFVASYEEGGSCSNTFAPVTGRTTWASAETTIVTVDSITGQVTGKRIGDALVVPSSWVTTGPQSILVHVR
jgi:hypothetical protein